MFIDPISLCSSDILYINLSDKNFQKIFSINKILLKIEFG